jgi:hypothetical protein
MVECLEYRMTHPRMCITLISHHSEALERCPYDYHVPCDYCERLVEIEGRVYICIDLVEFEHCTWNYDRRN